MCVEHVGWEQTEEVWMHEQGFTKSRLSTQTEEDS